MLRKLKWKTRCTSKLGGDGRIFSSPLLRERGSNKEETEIEDREKDGSSDQAKLLCCIFLYQAGLFYVVLVEEVEGSKRLH